MSRKSFLSIVFCIFSILILVACEGGELSQGDRPRAQEAEAPTATPMLVLAPTAEPTETALPAPEIPEFLSVRITFLPAWTVGPGDAWCAKVGDTFNLQFEPIAPEGWNGSGITTQQYKLLGAEGDRVQLENESQWIPHDIAPGQEVVEPDGLSASIHSTVFQIDYFGYGFTQLVYRGPGEEEGTYCFSLPDSRGILLYRVTVE